jgi:ribose transport system permease protein
MSFESDNMTTPEVDAPRTSRVRHSASGRAQKLEKFALPSVWILMIAGFSIVSPETFPTASTVSNILGAQSIVLVLSICILIPLVAGDYDLSVAYNLCLSAMVIAVLNAQHGWPILLAIVAALAVGTFIGVVNGTLVTVLGIDPIIATLGVGTLATGVTQWISGSAVISGVSQELVQNVIIGRFLGVPYIFWYALALCAAAWYALEFTPAGRRLLFVGRNRSVAKLSGLPVNAIRMRAFMLSGFLAAFAGVLYAGTLGGADPSSGTTYLLPGFAAVFLGATTIRPGRFNAWGCFIAVYFLGTGIFGLQLLGLQSYVQPLFYGGALIVAVAFSQILRGREALQTN